MKRYSTYIGAFTALIFLIALAGCFGPKKVETAADGDTHLTNLVLSGDLTVGDDITITDDVTVTDDLTVTGAADITETLAVTGASTLTGALAANGGITVDTSNFTVNGTTGAITGVAGATLSGGDLTLSVNPETDSAWASGDQNLVVGIPRFTLVALGTMTNGTTETTCYVDDTPAAEWAAVGGTADPTDTEDATIYRKGSKSLKLAWLDAAVNGDGVENDITNDDLSSNESIGFWVYSDTAITSGDLKLWLDDDDASPDPSYDIGAVTANIWTWVELDVSGCDGGGTDCDVVDKVAIKITTQGATNLGDFNIYFDGMYKWDAADEEALGVETLGSEGVAVWTVATSAGTANTQAVLTEMTDFFVHDDSSTDALVTISDQSANSGLAVVFY